MAAAYRVRWKPGDEPRAGRPQTWPFPPGEKASAIRPISLIVARNQLRGGRMP